MRTAQPSTVQGKALVPLLGVLATLAIGVSAVAIVLQMRERDRRVAVERELVIAQTEREELKSQLQDVTQQKASAEQQLAMAQADLTKTKTDLDAAITAKDALTRSIEDRQKEIERLTKDLEQARTDRKQLASDLDQLRSQRVGLQRQVQDLESAKSDLQSKVMELSEHPTVELDKIVVGDTPQSSTVRSDYAAPAPVSLTDAKGGDGQVIVVNREYDFVVMNLGKNHGLSIGQEFQILRGADVVGKVKVEKVYDELSAAAILPESNKDLIQEGDGVRAL